MLFSKMINKINKITLIIAMALLLFIFVLLTNLQYIAFSDGFYKNEFSKYRVELVTGMDINQLMNVAEKVQKYLSGRTDSLQIKAYIFGEQRYVFNDRELKHMKDVRELFKRGFLLKNLSGIIFFLLLIFAVYKKPVHIVFGYIYKGMSAIFIIILLMTAIVSLNFDKWFTNFHLVFFNNDLWQLDITKDKLIQMFPLSFFQDAAFLTVRNSLIIILIVAILSYFLSRIKTAKKPD